MSTRRYDLDWLRIFAFGLLIFYHVGMFYVSWDWHVKSSRASDAIEPLMRLSSPWRLSLLFLISGAGTRFLVDKRANLPALALGRLRRLGLPLLLGMLVIVPPQSYYEVVEALRMVPDEFYLKYLTASGHWCDADGCLITPTYNHLWFVAYLIVYTLVLLTFLPLLRTSGVDASRFTVALINGPCLVLVPWGAMFFLRVTLAPRFGQTHEIWNDWYLHPLYFLTFLFGYAVARADAFFHRCAQLRWTALSTALVAWLLLELNRHWQVVGMSSGGAGRLIGAALRELQAWMVILASVGFAHQHLRNTENRVRRVLTQAIFSFYVVHQTLIVVLAHHLDRLQMPILLEAGLLVTATGIGCWLFFCLGRRVPALGQWMGIDVGRSATVD
jgi:surface polysaccharide O-acyltransferase-like enzyme